MYSSPREEPRILKLESAVLVVASRRHDAGRISMETPHQLQEFTGPPRDGDRALQPSSCPVSKRTLPALVALAKVTRREGVSVLLMRPTATDSAADLRSAMIAVQLVRSSCLRDSNGQLLASLGARSTTDVFLLDAAQTLHLPRRDSVINTDWAIPAIRRVVPYLADAIRATLAGRLPEPAGHGSSGLLT